MIKVYGQPGELENCFLLSPSKSKLQRRDRRQKEGVSHQGCVSNCVIGNHNLFSCYYSVFIDCLTGQSNSYDPQPHGAGLWIAKPQWLSQKVIDGKTKTSLAATESYSAFFGLLFLFAYNNCGGTEKRFGCNFCFKFSPSLKK
jgi:hypothetical protein